MMPICVSIKKNGMSTPGRTADEAMVYNTINIPRITVSPGQEGQGRNNSLRVVGVAEALNYMTTGTYFQLGSDCETMDKHACNDGRQHSTTNVLFFYDSHNRCVMNP